MDKPKPTSGPEQFETTWLFPHVREIVRVDEVAKALGISENQVRAHVDMGNFISAPIGDASSQTRQHLRLMRFSIEAWWLEKLSSQGIEMPVRQSPQVTWWRAKLKTVATVAAKK